MTEKIGLIKNPLTIIAIFAGIAEVSGTLVLPFIYQSNQELFIYFLISFPSILVLLFFLTLNLNNKVLYAPSDYQDETNYIKINKYDISRQKNIELTVSKDDAKSIQVIQLTEKVNFLSTQILKLEESILNPDKKEKIFFETIGHEFRVTDFKNVNSFIKKMKKIGINFEIYQPPIEIDDDDGNGYAENSAIWLGKNVSLEIAKSVIKHSKDFYPHLKYIKLSHDEETTDIYIGGSTKSAVKYFKLVPLNNSNFEKLQVFEDLNSFHKYIMTFKKNS
jgi:hypothetical protein